MHHKLTPIFFIVLFVQVSSSFGWEYIFRDRGDNREDQLGTVIEGIGDQNQDGYDDILVQVGRTQEWCIYYGGDPMDTIPDWSVHAYSGGNNLGDLNGDEIPEFYIKYDTRDDDGNRVLTYSIFYGGDEDTIPDLILPERGTMNMGGDVNGDGYNDIWQVWSGYNHPESLFGRILLYLGDDDGLDTIPDFEMIGDWNHAHFGENFTSGGDLNGDGYYDFCCTSMINEEPYNDRILHIYFGGEEIDTSWGIHHDLRDSIGDYSLSSSFRMVNDLNGDGIDELILKITEHRGSIVIFGKDDFTLEPDLILNPGNVLGGYKPVSTGDVNNDGYNDILCIDPAAIYNFGKVNLFLGARWMDGDYVLQVTGSVDNELIPLGNGECRTGCGDVNGDGINDIMFSACGHSGQRYNMGEVYIIGGSDEWQTGVEEDEYDYDHPADFNITGVFPNPFNDKVVINYDIKHSGDMFLGVYDIKGRLIGTLENKFVVKGSHRLTWDSPATGIYFVVLDMGGERMVKKVVSLK